jgi:hypothetical protein
VIHSKSKTGVATGMELTSMDGRQCFSAVITGVEMIPQSKKK